MSKFFARYFSVFEDILQSHALEKQILESYGVTQLEDIGLRVEGRGTIVIDPAKVSSLESHRELQEKASRFLRAA